MGLRITGENKHHCRMMHMENGKVWVRKVYSLTVQASNGRVYHLDGDKLPEAIVISSSQGKQGRTTGQVLLRPSVSDYLAPTTDVFPTGRDILMMILSLSAFFVVRAFFDGLANAF